MTDWSFPLSDVTLEMSIELSRASRMREVLRPKREGEPSHCSLCRARWLEGLKKHAPISKSG